MINTMLLIVWNPLNTASVDLNSICHFDISLEVEHCKIVLMFQIFISDGIGRCFANFFNKADYFCDFLFDLLMKNV